MRQPIRIPPAWEDFLHYPYRLPGWSPFALNELDRCLRDALPLRRQCFTCAYLEACWLWVGCE